MKKLFALTLVTTLLAACATPVQFTDKPMKVYDKETEYYVEQNDQGLMVYVTYGSYQFIPDQSPVIDLCRAATVQVAMEEAQHIGRAIQDIDPKTIRLSMGRNIWTGTTTCSSKLFVTFK